ISHDATARRSQTEARTAGSYFLRPRVESGGDRGSEAVPAVSFLLQTLSSRRSQFIKFCAAIVLRGAPACFQETLADEPEQRGIQRALFDEQRPSGNLFDAQQHAVTMQRPERHRLQNQKIERSRKNLRLRGHPAS